MKLTFHVFLALAIRTVFGGETKCPGSNNLTVQTSSGTYTGIIEPKYPNTRQFRAVPFAEPPVLSRRFLAPQKISRPPTEHHYVTRYPPSCPQFVTSEVSLYSLNLTQGNLIYNGNQNGSSGLVGEATSEDCLYSAIWTPTTPPPPGGFPVLYFLTGGGYILGGLNIPWQLPTSWVERTQSHIVVTINYRLDILGFPNARGLKDEDQNLGILDSRLALEWVRDNIAAFGGDPSRITLWGQSAGSIGADVLAYAYYKDPIASSFYLESGTTIGGWPNKDPDHTNFTFVARHFGCEAPCGVDDGGAAELECMRHVPFAQLINFIGQRRDAGTQPALVPFILFGNNRSVFENYTGRAAAGQIARRPIIISNTANEFSSLVPWPINNLTEGPYQPAVTALDVSRGNCPSYNSTVYRNRMGPDVPVFRLQYAGTFPNLNYYKWLGAYHASDLPIIFGTYHLLDGIANTTDYEVQVSHALQDHVLAFAKDPHNGPQKMGWNPQVTTDPDGGQVLRIGADGKLAQIIKGVEIDGPCNNIGEYNPFP